MDARLETALLGVLDRVEAGADVSESWLRETYPDCWTELAGFVGIYDRLKRGRPQRETYGPYRVLRRLGQGGMGAVYLAEVARPHEGVVVGERVALKVVHRHLLARPGFLARTLREARLGKSVAHRNVVRTLDVGVETKDGVDEAYLVTEYVEGQNLRGLLHETEVVPESLCRHVAREVLAGLVAIHEAGVVHRDLKPENVIVSRGGATATDVVKIADLGAARSSAELESPSEAAGFLGSVLYAAPEQFAAAAGADVDGRADLYALGVMLHELAAGRHPFAETGAARRRGELAAANPTVSPFFEEFVGVLMDDARERRFASAADALATLVDGETSPWWTSRAGRTPSVARRARTSHATPLIGRAPEMAALRAQFDRASAGQGRTVLVEGEAGVGKTRLVEEFVAGLGDSPHVLTATHSPGGGAPSADALVDALRGRFGAADDLESRLADCTDLAPAVRALLVGAPPAAGTPRLTRASLAVAAAALIRSLSVERPTIVVVDDLHFASREERALFAALSHALTDSRTLLVGASRPAADSAWAAKLLASPHVTRLLVDRLTADGVRALLDAAVGSDELAARLLPACAQRSDGNPYFVLEILRALRDEGRLVDDGAGGRRLDETPGPPPLPDTLRALVGARLADLDAGDRALLDAAACAGFEFEPSVVAEAIGAPTVGAARRFARLERRHRLVRSVGPRAAFDHHLVQEVLVDGMSPATAARLHAALAAVLDKKPALAADERVRVADHFVRAGDAAGTARRLPEALSVLESRFRTSAALDLCDRALALAPAPPTRLLALRAKARCLDVTARRDEQLATLRDALDVASSQDDVAQAADVRCDLAACLDATGRHADAVAAGESALRDAESRGDAVVLRRAHFVLATVLGRHGREDEALAHARGHLELARAADDGELVASGLALLAATLQHMNRYEEAHERLEQAIASADAATPRTTRVVRLAYAKSLTSLGRPNEAAPVLETLVDAARRGGDRGDEVDALEALSLARCRLGRWDDAGRTARAALALAEGTSDATRLAECRMREASILKWTGRWGEALDVYDRVVEAYARDGMLVGETTTRCYRAVLLAYLGEFRAARDDAERASRTAREQGFDVVLPLVCWALGLTNGDGATPDVAALREAARLAGPGYLPPVRAEIALALAAAELETPAGAASARAALDAGRAANLPAVAVVASTYLAVLRAAPAADAFHELTRHEAALPVGRRLEARWRLGLLTQDAALLRGASEDLALLRKHAPARCRDSMVANVPLFAAVAGR